MSLANRLVALLGPGRCSGCGGAVGPLCPRCRPLPAGDSDAPPAARVIAAWDYGGAARSLILAVKVRGRRDAAAPLVSAALAAARRAGVEADIVTWVPGRAADVRNRGFDHAELIASGVARGLGLPRRRLLARRGTASDQAGLTAAERLTNLRAEFRSVRCTSAVLLVDDVMTTGATISACARALLSAGARRVEALVACRRP